MRRPDVRRPGRALVALLCLVAAQVALAAAAVTAAENWQLLGKEASRTMEIDRGSIRRDKDDKHFARARMRFERPLFDGVSGRAYAILETHSRFDCDARTVATVKRVYVDDKGSAFREEDTADAPEFPVRTGSMDDKVMRVACRPITPTEQKDAFDKTLKAANAVAAEVLKGLNDKRLRQEVMTGDLAGAAKKTAAPAVKAAVREPPPAAAAPVRTPRVSPPRPQQPRAPLPPPPPAKPSRWAYAGDGGPAHWAEVRPEYRLCGSGRRQSPINLADAIRVDLPALAFDYRPTHFRVADTGTAIDVATGELGFVLLGKRYVLQHIRFHHPAEDVIDGRHFPMGAHLVHRAADGEIAIVAVVFEAGAEHPVVQAFWNHLPLEAGREVAPPDAQVDLAQLLPESRGYLTYLGSLTAPPCTEDVRWIVLRQPVPASTAQIEILGRLYPDNARPLQPLGGRLIKESR